jgi:hypothetical protein
LCLKKPLKQVASVSDVGGILACLSVKRAVQHLIDSPWPEQLSKSDDAGELFPKFLSADGMDKNGYLWSGFNQIVRHLLLLSALAWLVILHHLPAAEKELERPPEAPPKVCPGYSIFEGRKIGVLMSGYSIFQATLQESLSGLSIFESQPAEKFLLCAGCRACTPSYIT